MRTHYQTLKVAEDAPPEVIKAAYRALSQQHHPDSNPPDQQEEALRAMQAINTAYEALIEPEGRAAYDEGLRVERAAGTNGPAEAHSGGSLVPDPRATSSTPPEQPRRRRRSSSGSLSRPSSSALAHLPSNEYHSSGSHALVRADRSLAPMFSSAQSSTIYGRPMERAEEEGRRSADAGVGRSGGGRGTRLVLLALAGLVMGMMLLGGLVVWKLGLTSRLWAWYKRHFSEESALTYGSDNDFVSTTGGGEKPYARPALTPHGSPWPTSTGYLPGAPVLWNDGYCEIIVDNTLHDSDVHVKIVAIPVPLPAGEGKGAAAPGEATTVREAFVTQRARMKFEGLRPGTYELRYRSLRTGLIVRAATLELKQGQDAQSSTSVMTSLYKVAAGNSQRPVLEEDGF